MGPFRELLDEAKYPIIKPGGFLRRGTQTRYRHL